jgi:tRNA pseudouridine38-40 synthase
MQDAASYLLGRHDFSAFRAANCQAKSSEKILYEIDISGSGPFIRFKLTANAFLYHMVRNIVGCLVAIGCQRRTSEWLVNVLHSRNRKLAAPTFSPAGLYLSTINYPSEFKSICQAISENQKFAKYLLPGGPHLIDASE